MEQLIVKYLQGSLSKEEEKELKAWLKNRAINRKVFENIVGEWNLTKKEIDQAKESVLRRITATIQDKPTKKQKGKSHLYLYITGIAASLLIITTILFFFHSTGFAGKEEITQQETFIEKETANGQKLTFELPDGTIVKLNAGSKLTFPKIFGNNGREVTLKGEAFFNVTRNEQNPFRIISDNMQVEVLGTSFNVRSYPDENFATVAVKTGHVAVTNFPTKDQILLNPKEAVTYKNGKHDLSKTFITDDMLFFGWMDQQIIFQDEEITEIFKILSRWYDVDFEIKRDLNEGKEFTAKYKNPRLSEVMESLSYAYDFKYTQDGKKIIID